MSKNKKVKIILPMVAVLLILLFIGISYFMGSQVVLGSTQLVTNESTTGVSDDFWETYNMDYDAFCETYTIERIEILSTFDDHTIPADYIYAAQADSNKNHKTVVMVHGLGGNRYSCYPVAQLFLEKGYNIIAYDQRSTNENTAPYTTFGYWEKYDLMDYIDYATEQAPEQQLGVWGTSFGGATAGLAMGNAEAAGKVDFLILDCPVSSMQWMVEEEMRNMDLGIPISYMTWCGNMVNRLQLGFSYQDADVCTAVQKLEMPVLVMNSKVDVVTPQFMGQAIYDSIESDKKMLWTAENSPHAEMWIDENQTYREQVEALLAQCE